MSGTNGIQESEKKKNNAKNLFMSPEWVIYISPLIVQIQLLFTFDLRFVDIENYDHMRFVLLHLLYTIDLLLYQFQLNHIWVIHLLANSYCFHTYFIVQKLEQKKSLFQHQTGSQIKWHFVLFCSWRQNQNNRFAIRYHSTNIAYTKFN